MKGNWAHYKDRCEQLEVELAALRSQPVTTEGSLVYLLETAAALLSAARILTHLVADKSEAAQSGTEELRAIIEKGLE